MGRLASPPAAKARLEAEATAWQQADQEWVVATTAASAGVRGRWCGVQGLG
jgi:hypothetical protein